LQAVNEPERADIVAFPCDISKMEEVQRKGTQILEKFGHIDLLINNAGFGEFGKLENQSIEQIETVMRTNYFGMVYCTKVFLQSMLSRHSGHIVNVASLAASFGVPGLAGYCASKYAMLGFSESLYYELYGTGVRITVVLLASRQISLTINLLGTINQIMPALCSNQEPYQKQFLLQQIRRV
jgi:short-subunit dehydrogenase